MYPFAKIEKKWQKTWLIKRTYEPDLRRAKKPFYNLMMFPYPSAEGMHVGNMFTFTGADVYGRLKRMQGNDVFEPIGLDGFGIHSENYAIKVGKHPAKQAKISKKNFYRQLQMIGNGFAWNERLETYDPAYYKWTQWIFVQMFKRGLAYRKKSPVNWCPSCKTVLADEQVIDSKCERCSSVVFKKELEQWFFRITKYADKLLKNLDRIDWSEKVKIAQRNWIGKSEGALITFPLVDIPGQEDGKHSIEIFTTRPDTLYGATFMVISPERGKLWLDIGWQADKKIKKYIVGALARRSSVKKENTIEKTGIFSGVSAINPANKNKIPVWISDYVLGDVGTGVIMAVPAHDDRDYDFAKKFNLPINKVIEPVTGPILPNEEFRKSIVAIVENPKTGKILCLDWTEKYGGVLFIGGGLEGEEDAVETARREIKEETGYKNLKFIQTAEKSHHHYFAFSKNVARNIEVTGVHFELINEGQDEQKLEENEKGKFTVLWLSKNEVEQRVRDENHALLFQKFIRNKPYTGTGITVNSGKFSGLDSGKAKEEITKFVHGSPKVQYRLRDWLISRQRYWGPPIPMIFCEKCSTLNRGERKDMPGWYVVPEKQLPVKLPYVKNFRPTGTDKSPLALIESFYKVRCPQCRSWARRETDVSDTFLDSAWYYLGYFILGNQKSKNPWLPAGRKNQKFIVDKALIKKWLPANMYIGGAEHAVLHLLYVRFLAMFFKDIKLINFEEPFHKFRTNGIIIKDGSKMSKSKGNVVNPDEYIKNFGADALRMYFMFIGPFEDGGDFNDSGIKGTTRFLERVWAIGQTKKFASKTEIALEASVNKAIKKIRDDIESLSYNTAISTLMILLNDFDKHRGVITKKQFESFLKLLAPFAPHITEELWSQLKNKKTIHKERWPEYNQKLSQEDYFDLVIQVNGKLRAKVRASTGLTEKEAVALALKDTGVSRYIGGKKITKIVFVPNRLINLVI